MWIGAGFGSPERFSANNGVEYAKEEFTGMCENFNISIMHTAAQNPFSSELCERKHAVKDEMVRKIAADQPICPLRIALAWVGML